jgi:hypothetical protein
MMEADMAVEAAVADSAGAGSFYSRPDVMKVRQMKKKATGRCLEMACSTSVMMQSAPMVRLGMAPPPGALMANTGDNSRRMRRSEPAEAPMLSTESFGKVSDTVSTEPTSQHPRHQTM